jgi:integrase
MLHFKLPVPQDVQSFFDGKTHIRHSLKTSDIDVAKKLAEAEAERYRLEFGAARVPVRCQGVEDLAEYGKELVHTATRKQLLQFADGLDDMCRQVRRWLEADKIPPVTTLNGVLNREWKIKVEAEEGATQGDLRTALKTFLHQIVAVWDTIDAELMIPEYGNRFVDLVPSGEGRRTVSDVIDRILKRGERSKATADNLVRHIKLFTDQQADIKEALTDERVEDFKDELLKSEKAMQTVHNIWASLSLFAKTAHSAGYVDRNPVDGIKLPAVGKGTGKRAFTLDELQAIKGKLAADTSLYSVATLIAIWTGARQGEITQLYGDDVDLKKGTMRIHADRDDMKLKNATSERLIPLHDALLNDERFVEAVREAQKENSRIVTPTTARNANQGYSKPLSRWFTKLKKNMELNDEKRLDFHSLRRSWITQADLQGIPHDIAQMYTGHKRSSVSAVHDGYISERDLDGWRVEVNKLELIAKA